MKRVIKYFLSLSLFFPVILSIPAETSYEAFKPHISVVEAKVTCDIDCLLKREFGHDWLVMREIMRCESQSDPKAVNHADAEITGYSSWGLFQINSPEFDGWDNPETNIRAAKKKYDSQGLNAWTNCIAIKVKNPPIGGFAPK